MDATDARPNADATPVDVPHSDVPAPEVPTQAGFIHVFGPQTRTGSWMLDAMFYDFSPGSPPACTRSIVAGCTIVDCRNAFMLGLAPGTLPSTGNISVWESSPFSTGIMPGYDNQYRWGGTPIGPATVGDTVHIDSEGNIVPTVHVGLPIGAALRMSLPDGSTPVIIDRSAGLEVSWEPIEGVVSLFLTQEVYMDTHPIADSMAIECLAEGADGGMSVPAEVLAGLDPRDGATRTTFYSVQRVNRVPVALGEYAVVVSMGAGGIATYPTVR